MRRFLVTACALFLALGVLALADNGSHLGWICTSSPIDANVGGDMNLKAATAAPYQPGTISTTYRVPMEGYSGFVVRAKYARGETITTAAVVRLWGVKGSNYIALADNTGVLTVTLDDAASDCDDGATYKWTAPSNKIDALGSPYVVATVQTAAVSSSTGAVVLEWTRF